MGSAGYWCKRAYQGRCCQEFRQCRSPSHQLVYGRQAHKEGVCLQKQGGAHSPVSIGTLHARANQHSSTPLHCINVVRVTQLHHGQGKLEISLIIFGGAGHSSRHTAVRRQRPLHTQASHCLPLSRVIEVHVLHGPGKVANGFCVLATTTLRK